MTPEVARSLRTIFITTTASEASSGSMSLASWYETARSVNRLAQHSFQRWATSPWPLTLR